MKPQQLLKAVAFGAVALAIAGISPGLAQSSAVPVLFKIDMGDLPAGMHTGVGAPGRAQPHRGPKHRRERLFQETGDGALTCLRCPTREIRSVISDIEPKTNTPAISVDGGCVVQR